VLWTLLLPTASLAITIFWQILTGFAVTSFAIFGAAFFKRSQLASIAVTLISFLLSVLAAWQENLPDPISLARVVGLSLFFPPMNYVFFFDFVLKAEIAGLAVDLGQPLPALEDKMIPGQARGVNWVQLSSPGFLFGFLALQIVLYTLLAILVESLLHGSNRKRRGFNPNAETDRVAVETSGLVKHYTPSLLTKMFCWCSRTKTVKAVDGLDLRSQRNQILCLLGPNGSGKTTTLDMLAGFQTPTDGSVTFNTLPSQLGMSVRTALGVFSDLFKESVPKRTYFGTTLLSMSTSLSGTRSKATLKIQSA
jgi:ATP-binding cassette, subfamily A (ABC1), member 3